MIAVVIADDHPILRDGLRYILEGEADIQIIATVSNGLEAVEQAIQHCPDVVLMDISMPVMNGITATKLIREKCANTKVAILSMYHTSEHIQSALKAGAQGYLLKDSAGSEVVEAVRALHDGKRFLSPKING
jgi:DNA-binding NarL/FixJ family response regulator